MSSHRLYSAVALPDAYQNRRLHSTLPVVIVPLLYAYTNEEDRI